MQKCFQGCSEITINLIAFELLEKRQFKAGDTILRANKRSILNLEHKDGLEPQTSLIQKSVLADLSWLSEIGATSQIRNTNKW